MIVEERIYTMQPGHSAEWLAFYAERGLPVQQRLLGTLVGFFQSETGALNQVVHLWSYDSLADRATRRARMKADPDWRAYLREAPKVVLRMEKRILMPVAFSPLQ